MDRQRPLPALRSRASRAQSASCTRRQLGGGHHSVVRLTALPQRTCGWEALALAHSTNIYAGSRQEKRASAPPPPHPHPHPHPALLPSSLLPPAGLASVDYEALAEQIHHNSLFYDVVSGEAPVALACAAFLNALVAAVGKRVAKDGDAASGGTGGEGFSECGGAVLPGGALRRPADCDRRLPPVPAATQPHPRPVPSWRSIRWSLERSTWCV